jgi:hypothetical protein
LGKEQSLHMLYLVSSNVHWGIVAAQKPLSCCCRHHPFLLQALHRDAQDNEGSIDGDDQKHPVGEYCPLFAMESWALVLMDQVIIS